MTLQRRTVQLRTAAKVQKHNVKTESKWLCRKHLRKCYTRSKACGNVEKCKQIKQRMLHKNCMCRSINFTTRDPHGHLYTRQNTTEWYNNRKDHGVWAGRCHLWWNRGQVLTSWLYSHWSLLHFWWSRLAWFHSSWRTDNIWEFHSTSQPWWGHISFAGGSGHPLPAILE